MSSNGQTFFLIVFMILQGGHALDVPRLLSYAFPQVNLFNSRNTMIPKDICYLNDCLLKWITFFIMMIAITTTLRLMLTIVVVQRHQREEQVHKEKTNIPQTPPPPSHTETSEQYPRRRLRTTYH